MLCTRKFVQTNFQISQNTRNWFDIPYFATYACHLKGKKSNVLPISVILADFEINLGEFCGLEPPKLDNLCFRVFILLEKKNQIVGSKVKLLEQNEWRICLQKAIN